MIEPPQAIKPTHPPRWAAMWGMSLFLFSAPWLSLFNHRTLILGIPLILLYLFGTAALLIAISATMKSTD